MDQSDQELLRRIEGKDPKAFREFYERYARLLYEWAYNRTKDMEATHEIAQSFWEAIWLTPSVIKADEEGCAKNFLLRYYTFRILDYIKARQNELCERLSERDFATLAENDDLSYSHILEEYQAKEIHRLMDRAVAELPETAREVFHLRWELNYSTSEVAARLGLKEKEIYNRYHRLLQYIRGKIAKAYIEVEGSSRKESSGIHLFRQES